MNVVDNVVIRTDVPMSRSRRLWETVKSSSVWGGVIYKIAIYVLLCDFGFVFLFPFLYMIVTSLKSPIDLMDITVHWVPTEFYWRNYLAAFYAMNFWAYIKNSALVTILSVAGNIISCSFIAYGFARCKFRGRDTLFMLVMITLLVPTQVIAIPLYMQYFQMKWISTYLPLIVPTFFGMGLRGALFIFIFRQFFLGMPYELEDAARIDGCSTLRIWWNIVLPISKPAILVSAILSMVWHWNDYYEPGLYIVRSEKWLLPMVLPHLYQILQSATIEMDAESAAALEGLKELYTEGTVMAATFMTILPLLIVYLVLQRQFMESVERTGLVG